MLNGGRVDKRVRIRLHRRTGLDSRHDLRTVDTFAIVTDTRGSLRSFIALTCNDRRLLIMRTQSPDTSPEAEKVMIELLRQASATRKFQMVEANQRLVRCAAMAGLRERHPSESDGQLKRRLADLLLGEELAMKAYGPIETQTANGE